MRCEELYRLLNIYWQQDDRDIAYNLISAHISTCPSCESHSENISCSAMTSASSSARTSAMRLIETRPSIPRALWMLYVTIRIGKILPRSAPGIVGDWTANAASV